MQQLAMVTKTFHNGIRSTSRRMLRTSNAVPSTVASMRMLSQPGSDLVYAFIHWWPSSTWRASCQPSTRPFHM